MTVAHEEWELPSLSPLLSSPEHPSQKHTYTALRWCLVSQEMMVRIYLPAQVHPLQDLRASLIILLWTGWELNGDCELYWTGFKVSLLILLVLCRVLLRFHPLQNLFLLHASQLFAFLVSSLCPSGQISISWSVHLASCGCETEKKRGVSNPAHQGMTFLFSIICVSQSRNVKWWS